VRLLVVTRIAHHRPERRPGYEHHSDVADAKTRPTEQSVAAMSGWCLHIKRLSDVDLTVLEKVVSASVKKTKQRHS